MLTKATSISEKQTSRIILYNNVGTVAHCSYSPYVIYLNDYYLVDSFNEMVIPFPAKGSKERYELLASYGDKMLLLDFRQVEYIITFL